MTEPQAPVLAEADIVITRAAGISAAKVQILHEVHGHRVRYCLSIDERPEYRQYGADLWSLRDRKWLPLWWYPMGAFPDAAGPDAAFTSDQVRSWQPILDKLHEIAVSLLRPEPAAPAVTDATFDLADGREVTEAHAAMLDAADVAYLEWKDSGCPTLARDSELYEAYWNLKDAEDANRNPAPVEAIQRRTKLGSAALTQQQLREILARLYEVGRYYREGRK